MIQGKKLGHISDQNFNFFMFLIECAIIIFGIFFLKINFWWMLLSAMFISWRKEEGDLFSIFCLMPRKNESGGISCLFGILSGVADGSIRIGIGLAFGVAKKGSITSKIGVAFGKASRNIRSNFGIAFGKAGENIKAAVGIAFGKAEEDITSSLGLAIGKSKVVRSFDVLPKFF